MWSNISAPRSFVGPSIPPALKTQFHQSVSSEDNKQLNGDCGPVALNEKQVDKQYYDSEQNLNIYQESGSPLARFKHAVCSSPNGYIYIHGGRTGNCALYDDIWRFDPHQNSWSQMKTSGRKPPNLQEHTLVEYNEQLYLFGGQVSASNDDESFWRLDLVNNEWHSLKLRSSKYGAYLGPSNRRGHSAVIYGDSMYIFGGFEDFRGSSSQLWEYDLMNQRWELRNLSSLSAIQPEPRHSHSAIVHDCNMYIYGGLSNLKPLGDLWRWSWRDKRWFKEKTRGRSPGQLHGHSAIQAFGSMFVFGGERNGRTTRGLWRLNLTNLTWQKINPKGPRPDPTTFHCAIANPLSILDETNYIVEGDHEFLRDTSATSTTTYGCYRENQDRGSGDSETSSIPIKREPESKLTHSKSTIADLDGAILSSQNHQQADRRLTRRSRLNFLARRNNNRPRSSNYELGKQLPTSSSASNFIGSATGVHGPNAISQRHSVAAVTSATNTNGKLVHENGNARILDNLEMDIKEIFQRTSVDEVTGEEIMSVIIPPSSIQDNRSSIQTSASQYQTAPLAPTNSSSGDQDQGMANSDTLQNLPKSQRTSYAFTTPSESLNTLRGEVIGDNTGNQTRIRHNNGNNQRAPGLPGYNRRDNRPKSEILDRKKLIGALDDKIKRLYYPHFHQDGGEQNRNSLVSRRDTRDFELNGNQDRTDKSKRHTIHQTMTYYNLYFSEDKSSDSPTSSEKEEKLVNNSVPFRMIRDDLSSHTIRGTSGALIGIHGASSISGSSHSDHRSQLSLESDSRTICGDLNNQTGGSSSGAGATSTTMNGGAGIQLSSLTNALTSSRDHRNLAASIDVAESQGDDTSRSFSVIAEFEEDDMFSLPNEPGMAQESSRDQSDETNDDEMEMDTDYNNLMQTTPARANLLQQKSSSSGYDSISNSENQKGSVAPIPAQRQSIINHQQQQQQQQNGNHQLSLDTQEDSSVRTESSSGFTTNPETSPEQSAVKKAKNGRQSLYRRAKNQFQITNSSTTADSLALTSEGLGDSGFAPSKSLPSSPPEDSRSVLQRDITSATSSNNQIMSNQTQSKMSNLISRSKFFSKSRSKNRYWQLCMFVIGGKQPGNAQGANEPITIWRLYI